MEVRCGHADRPSAGRGTACHFLRTALEAAVLIAIAAAWHRWATPGSTSFPPASQPPMQYILAFGFCAVFLLAYEMLLWNVEAIGAADLANDKAASHLSLGGASGFLLCSFAALLLTGLAMLGGRPVANIDYSFAIMPAAVMSAVGGEILVRGVIFRRGEQVGGTICAIVASALASAFLPTIQAGVTLGAVATSIALGFLCCAAYAALRTLWFPIGIQLGWVVGASGLYGSSFAHPAASTIAILLCLAAAALMSRRAIRDGKWVANQFAAPVIAPREY